MHDQLAVSVEGQLQIRRILRVFAELTLDFLLLLLRWHEDFPLELLALLVLHLTIELVVVGHTAHL